MAVEKIGEKYRCNGCGNEVEVTEVGGGILVCYGQDMERIEVETPEVINLPDADGFQDKVQKRFPGEINKVPAIGFKNSIKGEAKPGSCPIIYWLN